SDGIAPSGQAGGGAEGVVGGVLLRVVVAEHRPFERKRFRGSIRDPERHLADGLKPGGAVLGAMTAHHEARATLPIDGIAASARAVRVFATALRVLTGHALGPTAVRVGLVAVLHAV